MNWPVFRRFSRYRSACLACALIAASLLGACRRAEPEEPPVATPSLTLSRERVAIGSPVKLTYRFQVAEGARIEGDYWVFVHVLDSDGAQMWTDDHQPPTPTSQWKGGQTVEYTRTVFAPSYPYIGEAVVRLGLYSRDSNRRLRLAGEEVTRREYIVARFQVLPQSENIFLIYREGWHPAEVAADNPASEWQWTAQKAVISFRNPRKDSLFYLEYDARADQFPTPQQVTVRAGDQAIASFPATAREKALLTFPVTAAQLGTAEMAQVSLEVDRTFKAPGDVRELGIRVFHAFIEPQ
jgi:hypothetical protein